MKTYVKYLGVCYEVVLLGPDKDTETKYVPVRFLSGRLSNGQYYYVRRSEIVSGRCLMSPLADTLPDP